MPEKDNLDRRLRKLTVEHGETRWLALRLDDDVKEVQATQRQHSTRFDAIDATLEIHTTILEDHTTRLHEHSRILNEHSRILDEHSRILDEHSRILNEHSATLEEHSVLLQEHSVLLQEHSLRFDSVDSQLRSLTFMVGQVLDRLPEEPCKN